MITCDSVQKQTVRGHYNLATLFYRLLWGKHIHHGYWHGDESSLVAQVQLTERLAELINIPDGAKVLDIGCGMGGSSIHLARGGCHVTGVTLSTVQRSWAATSAFLSGVSSRTRFQVRDVETVSFEPGEFDVIWSIECTEHVFDKTALFQNIQRWLRPGGRVGICAWLAGPQSVTPEGRALVERVCDDFFCPSLGTAADYQGWMIDAGLVPIQEEICTEKVSQTWEICRQRVERWRVRNVAKVIDRDSVRFIDAFPTILEAYRTRAMDYGIFVAEKPKE